MNETKPALLIFNYKKTNTYAINVLVGALERAFCLQEIEIIFATKLDVIVSLAKEACRKGRKVVIAWSFYSSQFIESLHELYILKQQLNSSVIHLAGGFQATAEPEQTLRRGFDFVAIGEGERTIIDFLSRFSLGDDLKMKGIAYLDNGKYITNGPAESIDLNDYPPFAEKYQRFNPIEITRGCIYACKFCQTPFMFKAKFRHRTVENISHYVCVMKEYGLSDIRFITPSALSYGSSDNSVKLEKIEELLASVRKILGKKGRIFFGTFPSEIRPEHVTQKAMLILKKYVDNDNIIIGGQSGSQRILDMSHRGHTVEDILSAVKIAQEAGFLPNVDFIFGLPGETEEDIKASLKCAEQLSNMGARIHAHTFMPLPGTPFRNARPERLSSSTLRTLKRLGGSLYGHWRKQILIGQHLATLKDI